MEGFLPNAWGVGATEVKKIISWLKKWGAWLAGALLVILTLGFFGRHLWRSKLQAEDKAKVAEAEKELEYLRGLRAEVETRVGERDAAVRDIDVRLEQQREVIREAMRTGAGMSDEEIDAEFTRLGY